MMVVCCQLHTIHLKSTEDQGQICNHRATHLQYNRAPILRWKLINCSCGTSMVGNCIVHDDVMKNHSEIQTRGLEPFQATQTVASFCGTIETHWGTSSYQVGNTLLGVRAFQSGNILGIQLADLFLGVTAFQYGLHPPVVGPMLRPSHPGGLCIEYA